ncbi:hypothetical protein D9M68_642750 [compost metagenome]
MALVASATAIYTPAEAQVRVNVNIDLQPKWGPRGYNHVDYYYLPEIQSYYYVPTRQFIYLERNKWVHRKYLPKKYRHYDLYQGRKVVMNGSRPYLQHRGNDERYVAKYYKGKPSKYNKHDKKGKQNRGHRDRD